MADSDAQKRGKTSVDWEAAFAYYAALPPGARTYAAVAAHFNVSARTVETHGRTGGWKQRLRAIDAETAARTVDVLADARVEEVNKMRRLIEASLIAYAERLRDGMRMAPADLERLNRLSLALIDETTHPRARPDDDSERVRDRTPEHTAAVLAALEETGALQAIGLTRVQPDPVDTADDTDHASEESALNTSDEQNDGDIPPTTDPPPTEEEDQP